MILPSSAEREKRLRHSPFNISDGAWPRQRANQSVPTKASPIAAMTLAIFSIERNKNAAPSAHGDCASYPRTPARRPTGTRAAGRKPQQKRAGSARTACKRHEATSFHLSKTVVFENLLIEQFERRCFDTDQIAPTAIRGSTAFTGKEFAASCSFLSKPVRSHVLLTCLRLTFASRLVIR